MVRCRAGRRQAAGKLALAACLVLAVPVRPAEGQTQLRLVKTVTVTTTAEGGGARPEVVATADRVFVLYLGNIGSGSDRTFNVKIYDRDLETVLASRVLVSTTAEYGGPTDIRVASDGRSLYAFYETHRSSSATTATTYLWGARYSLDEAFTLVAATAAPIATSHPLSELPDGGEVLDDPAPVVGAHSVFVVTRIKSSLSRSGRTAYRVREFGKEDLAPLDEFVLDLSEAADGRARVASLLPWNGGILIALATTVSDQGLNEAADDGAQSDVVLVSMTPDWTFDPGTDVRTLTAEPGDRENYVSGLRADGRFFYLTYKQSVGSPPAGEHRAMIKGFDRGFRLAFAEQVRTAVWGPGGGEIRPSLEVRGSRLFSGQSGAQGIGTGNAEILVYEVTGPAVDLRVNGDPSDAVSITGPVSIEYTIRGGSGGELFLALEAPPLGIPWSSRNAAGQWIPLPANLGEVAALGPAPADGDHTLYSGTLTPGTYTLCLGYDRVPDGRLDVTGAVYDCTAIRALEP